MKTITDLKAKLAAATETPWVREGRTVYAITKNGRQNRFWLTVQSSRRASEGEASGEECRDIAAAIHALPALLEIAEAAGELRQLQKIDRQPMASDWSAFDAVEARLDAALAKLEAP